MNLRTANKRHRRRSSYSKTDSPRWTKIVRRYSLGYEITLRRKRPDEDGYIAEFTNEHWFGFRRRKRSRRHPYLTAVLEPTYAFTSGPPELVVEPCNEGWNV